MTFTLSTIHTGADNYARADEPPKLHHFVGMWLRIYAEFDFEKDGPELLKAIRREKEKAKP